MGQTVPHQELISPATIRAIEMMTIAMNPITVMSLFRAPVAYVCQMSIRSLVTVFMSFLSTPASMWDHLPSCNRHCLMTKIKAKNMPAA